MRYDEPIPSQENLCFLCWLLNEIKWTTRHELRIKICDTQFYFPLSGCLLSIRFIVCKFAYLMNIGEKLNNCKKNDQSLIDRSKNSFLVLWYWRQSCTKHTHLLRSNTLSMSVVSELWYWRRHFGVFNKEKAHCGYFQIPVPSTNYPYLSVIIRCPVVFPLTSRHHFGLILIHCKANSAIC